jgi:hypothetical protein
MEYRIKIDKKNKIIAFVEKGGLERLIAKYSLIENQGTVKEKGVIGGQAKDYKRFGTWKKAVEKYFNKEIDWSQLENLLNANDNK